MSIIPNIHDARVQYRLRHDDLSIERREWFYSAQCDFLTRTENEIRRKPSQEEEEEEEFTTQKEEIKAHDNCDISYNYKFDWLLPICTSNYQNKRLVVTLGGTGCNHSTFHQLHAKIQLVSESRCGIECYSVCYPGRMHRLWDDYSESINQIAINVFDELSNIIGNYDSVVFLSHGMGGIIAYEIVRFFQDLSKDNIQKIRGIVAIMCPSPLALTKVNYQNHKAAIDYKIAEEEAIKTINKRIKSSSRPPTSKEVNKPNQLLLKKYLPNDPPAVPLYLSNDRLIIQNMIQRGAISPVFQERKDILRIFAGYCRYDWKLYEDYCIRPPSIPFGEISQIKKTLSEYSGSVREQDILDVEDIIKSPPSLFRIPCTAWTFYGEDDRFLPRETVLQWLEVVSVHNHHDVSLANYYDLQSMELQEKIIEIMIG